LQRVVAPWSVHSAYNLMHPADMDEIRIYDRILSDQSVRELARPVQYGIDNDTLDIKTAAVPSDLSSWNHNLGFNQPLASVAKITSPTTRIRKVGFVDTKDLKQTVFKGADGIRETTWPGVYNRSNIRGRSDYLVLPDWNLYSAGGKNYRLELAPEPWNHIEINGSAFGKLMRVKGNNPGLLTYRENGQERTSHHWATTFRGGSIEFENDVQETPISEIGAYLIEESELPAHKVSLDYKPVLSVRPDSIPSLDRLSAFIAGRHMADERSQVLVAMPDAPALRYRPPETQRALPKTDLPIVHILIPGDFRDPPKGGAPTRLSYGWKNLNAGLDGVVLQIPALDLIPQSHGYLPINIRLKDPSWPARDLLDVNVWLKPGVPHNLWLDTRDLILPEGEGVYITLASSQRGFSADILQDMGISLRFKAREQAEAEHVHDRLEQARDNLGNLVEEQPNIRLFPIWDRFERDVSAVLQVAPDNALARSLWVEKNPEQPYQMASVTPPETDAPLWAYYQREDLRTYSRFVNWWIDHRQMTDGPSKGEFGGGLSDDTDLVNHWVPLALMGVDTEKIRQSQLQLLEATYRNGMWVNGLNRIKTDELHAYEEGINAVGQSMLLNWGSPSAIERAMSVAKNYPRLIERNPSGHSHFVSVYYSGTDIERTDKVSWQRDRSFLVTHPGLLLVDYNDSPGTKALLLSALDDWLDHSQKSAHSQIQLPAEIHWLSDQERGTGVGLAAHNFWAAYRWTGERKYLQPLLGFFESADLSAISDLNADVLHRLPQGAVLKDAIARGQVVGEKNFIDRNLGGINTRDFADLVRWQATGKKESLVDLYRREAVTNTGRLPYLTEAEAWTDRVSLPIETLQRTRLGGVALRRNAYYPGHLISWKFMRGGKFISGDEVAILIPEGDPEKFRIIAYNFSGKTTHAVATGWDVAPGKWKIVAGLDENNDDQIDRPSGSRTVRFEKGSDVTLELPSRQVKIFEFELSESGLAPSLRPDIGVEATDIAVDQGTLNITLHSLGTQATPPGSVVLENSDGKPLAELPFDAIEAPTDLLPKTSKLSWTMPSERLEGELTIRISLQGNPLEISAQNNVVVVEDGI